MKKISGIIVDPVARKKVPGTLIIDQGRIVDIQPDAEVRGPFILPGLIDSHIHIESSMLTPAAFAQKAVCHGTVAVMADPHEIANVLGIPGIDFMIASGQQAPLKFFFGAPSCVPATGFENSGARLGARDVVELLGRDDIFFLAEMMNFPGVIGQAPEVMAKLRAAAKMGKRVDGHAPGLSGPDLATYIRAGISTDHESLSLEECHEKLALGMKIQLRQGSSARNLDDLHPLITSHSGQCMLCTDDLKPADLARGHINLLVKKALSLGHDLFDILQCACVNPVRHYQLAVGLLQKGDPADFILVDDLDRMEVSSTWINGNMVSSNGQPLFQAAEQVIPINMFHAAPITAEQLQVSPCGSQIKVIEVTDGQIITGAGRHPVPADSTVVEADPQADLLKILVHNRYQPASPAIGFVRGFGLQQGAMASSIAHDSHNIIAVGVSDRDLARAVSLLQESGGICFVNGDEERMLELPVAGLMGLGSCEEMAANYSLIEQRVRENGCLLQTPFMTLSFLALPVIPALKITDLGLFDVERFELTNLFIEAPEEEGGGR